MQRSVLVFAAGGAVGALAAILLRPGVEARAPDPAATTTASVSEQRAPSPDRPSPDRAAPVAPRPEETPRLAPAPTSSDAVAARLASLEQEVRALRESVEALPKAPPDPWKGASIEAVRAKWDAALEAIRARLAEVGPQDPRGDIVHWSRWDDYHKARKALDEAKSLEDLKRLSGEFKYSFTWP